MIHDLVNRQVICATMINILSGNTYYNITMKTLIKTLIRPLKLLPQPGPILEKRAGSDTLKKTIYF